MNRPLQYIFPLFCFFTCRFHWQMLLALFSFTILLGTQSTVYAQVTKSVTVSSSIDNETVDLSPVNFTAADFTAGFTTVTKVEVSITWTKTDGTCTNQRSGGAYHSEVSFKLKGPNGVEINLASAGTWYGLRDIDYVTTVFSDDAASAPSRRRVPVSGTFLPTEALSEFDGIYALGDWVLIAGDSSNNDPLCVESYSIILTTSNEISCTRPILPLDNAVEVEKTTALSWNAIDGATGYYLYLGTDAGATNIENGLDIGNVTTYTPPANFDFGESYYWRVVPYGSDGAAEGCDTWSFSTKDYCVAGSQNQNEYISKVQIETIDNSTGLSADGYGDFTNISTDLIKGETSSILIDVVSGFFNLNSLAVWIDWNQDGVFNNSEERVVCEYGISSSNTFSISVPDSALPGNTRMRVRLDYNASEPSCGSPCDVSTEGETEDYTLYICEPPTILEQPSSSGEALCIGEDATELNVAVSGVDLTYQWYSNTSSSTTGGTLIADATSSKYIPPADVEGTFYYYCVINSNCDVSVTSNLSGAIIVKTETTPTFTQLSPICLGDSFTLPTTSTNGIQGTWSPAIDNTATTEYTFTPNSGECATTVKMTVSVNPKPSCDITGKEEPLCPNSTETYTAPSGMSSYAWSVEGATISAGANQQTVTVSTGTSGSTFTLTLTVTDTNGCSATCTKTLTVQDSIKPSISCPDQVSVNVDANSCQATNVDLGTPTVADNCSVLSTVNDAPSAFPVGTTTVTWTVTDVGGNQATCTQSVVVTDNQPPSFSLPANIELCVQNIQQANFDEIDDIEPDRPEYYLFESGDTALDLDATTFTDNCCTPASMTLSWTITFDGDMPAAISGTGQPSTYGTAIQLPGDGVTFSDKVHTITYKLEDCNGNHTEKTAQITIKPRPKIEKLNN